MLPRNPDTQEAAEQSTKRSLALYRHPPPRGRLRSGDSWLRAKQISDCLFEDQIHIDAKLKVFSIGLREQEVVVQNAVERFNPFGINVTNVDL